LKQEGEKITCFDQPPFSQANKIYWSDVHDHRIYSADMAEPEVRTPIVTDDGMRTDGISVDWIHQLIYFTCSTTRTSVDVARLDGTDRKTVIPGEPGSKLRAVVVDPTAGWMFFSDWGQKPKIERAGMDGSNRAVIVRGEGSVEWPNGLTIDHVASRLYWVDAKLHEISSAKFDGTDRRLVLQ
jgi:low density lipoprotein receptor-related protein 5/6